MTVIISICILVLAAYLFDLSASRTRIPSVILLLVLGLLLKQATLYFSLQIPNLSPALPVLGTIGLILIVMEGSLELEFNRKKAVVIRKSFFTALVPMLLMAFGLAWIFQFYGQPNFRHNLVNLIPLCVISSSIAIPSARSLGQAAREFVIYETSLSDILGVLLFNFVALNTTFGLQTFGQFFLQLLIMIVFSFAATIGLSLLLSRSGHHVKFIPIVMFILLIYAVSKVYHLPGLIFILIFGLFLGNLDKLGKISWLHKLNPEVLEKEVLKFRDLTAEGAFLIRSLFFLLFGYLIDTTDLLNTATFTWATAITAGIFILRAVQLLLVRIPFSPLLFMAPRGLITILLFLSIDPALTQGLVDKSLITQVIVLTSLVMMIGLMTYRREVKA